jgi:thioredoxin reductase (NADPH)
LRAEKIYQDLSSANPKIDFLWNHVVERVNGDSRFDGITVRNVEDPAKKKELGVGGVFVYIGHIPNTKFVDVDKTADGLIRTNACELKTSVPGIYAAGDCRETCLRQIATCVGDGALAAYCAGEYVERFKSGFA